MFSSSLRQRSEWSPALALFSQSPSKWRETNLLRHDLEFTVQYSASSSPTYRMVLISAKQVGTDDATRRIEQLPKDGTDKKAVVLLMQGHDAMSSFMRLQIHAGQLIGHLDALRRPSTTGMNGLAQIDRHAVQKDLLRHCVSGTPLSVQQVDVLLGSVRHLRELANMVQTREGQETICRLLGDADGRSLIEHFTNGPKFT
ncbi:hypothetical protein X797_010222 [Metarhizium robertsii]|uniref:Zinc carboxypeptidase A 1 n=2 Tax=Metarhizium robertsii TaxID=568076 RepID=A0A0B2XGS0_METRA|nr:zinc carboxypeptidase A 1 precursor [Metarhizium robertsii ARSEF 23]EXU96678.1 hypothetical protein X797_010222 [Metarhizium robertsii]KHO10747.1 zinc carboxypeptidase A 1 precursor [Metarhizium robertsii ARSEF 23]